MAETNDGVAELLATVEEIRRRKFPDLDPALIAEILETQRRYAESGVRVDGKKQTEQIINRWASREVNSRTAD